MANEILSDMWYNVDNGDSCFSGIDTMYNVAKQKGLKGITRKKIKSFLRSQPIYTKFKRLRKKFPRPHVMSWGIGFLMESDLAQLDDLARWNGGNRYILVLIDVFSKKVFYFLKNKSNI